MDISFLNSKIAMIKVPSLGFSGDIMELEPYTDHIKKYGNIKNITIQKNPVYTNILFYLEK